MRQLPILQDHTASMYLASFITGWIPAASGRREIIYAQLYIHDPAEALSMHNRRNPNLNPEIMSQLQDLMQDVNPYVALYRHAYLIMKDKPREEYPNIEVRLHVGDGTDGRRYNLPTVDEWLLLFLEMDLSLLRMIEILFYVCMMILSNALANFIQVINLFIMFSFFHMENWVGIYICSWKKLKQVNIENKKDYSAYVLCLPLTGSSNN